MTIDLDELRRTLTAGGSVRRAPVTMLWGPGGEVYDLLAPQSALLSVGASAGCAIVVPYPTVSARQCTLEFAGGWVICTHWPEAKNRTFVDGTPIYAAEVSFGSRLRLGDVELVAFANREQLADARALQLYRSTGENYSAGATQLGIPYTTMRRMVQRAQRLYDGVVAHPIEDEHTEAAAPHRRKRRHRSLSERVLGVPAGGLEGESHECGNRWRYVATTGISAGRWW